MKKNITSVVIAVIRRQGKYLLTQRRQNDPEDQDYLDHWQIPGGGQEFGETQMEAVIREAREELGLNIRIVAFIPRVFDSIRSDWHGLLHCYLCEIIDPQQPIILNEEANEYRWYTVGDIKRLKSFPETYNIIQEAEKLLLD